MEKFKPGKHIVLPALLLISHLMNAQVEVKFNKNEPERVKWIAQLKFFDYEFSALDPLRLGAGLAGDYMLPKRLSVHAEFNATYYQISNMTAKTFNTNLNPLPQFTKAEACIRFHLVDKIGKTKIKIETSREDMGSTTRIHYLKIPFPSRNIFGLRGGLYSSVEPVSTDNNSINSPFSPKPGLQTTDNLKWGGSGDPVFTSMNIFGFYGGISFISIINSLYDYGDGEYLYRRFRETYIDVLYVPSITFGDIKTASGVSHVKANETGSFKTSNIGARIGITVLKPKNFGIAYGFEAGVRPGVQNFGLYFGTKVSLVFANKNHDFPPK
jgi:hypothetical protein